MDPISAFLTLFFVMDPLGNVPVFLSVLKDYEPAQRQRIIMRELLIALLVMLFFLLMGSQFLSMLSLKQETVRISGGIVLFVIALRMVFPTSNGLGLVAPGHEPFFVPLAVPLVAGPSTLALIMLMAHEAPAETVIQALVIGSAWLLSAVILMCSTLLFRVLGNKGTIAIERLMGMLLVMISVQMFFDGVQGFLESINLSIQT